ncbi:phenylpyruvate decarboxylase ARO10 NDAI_0A04450 [Naumovozyma dairenensis CBS 421]|uniref:Pyruvate decarboxylase n=1 Tax=Naumovozyma dairenensis (strain ATCC 10597 / BCRC 20456 / CBS 421 / NBRC 0211 / NRRL Y-12639) TaxID=1071378 RepID=G0W463_NAUDC|nr:hypothetical protein NDAI_0A04450 [Naumovozyma dairenensis CBS 421]CCD22601.1 hypothetical protein NDAI_0A04450 [Naumovozyma dairenensis CBS 421]
MLADGFSRYSNKIGCLITTYGVGELSALNGIAGAFSENVKVLHIVGVARSVHSRSQDYNNQNLHHLVPRLHDSNFVGPNHKVYLEMIKDRVACSVTYLEDINTACDEVDKVIMDIYRYSKPGYVFVPVDFSDMLVDPSNLFKRPEITLENCVSYAPSPVVDELVRMVLQYIYESKCPSIIGDVLCDRFGASSMVNNLIQLTSMWNFATVMGKSIIDESNVMYMGLYNGNESIETVTERFLQSDLVLHFGIQVHEINNGHYTINYKEDAKVIEFHSEYIRFFDASTGNEKVFKGVNFVQVLERLIQTINVNKLNFEYPSNIEKFATDEVNLPTEPTEITKVTQNYLQKSVPHYLNPGDVLVCETGSFQFAIRDFVLPSQLKYITQGFFLSIGMALPAAFGVGIAMQDYPRCHISKDHPSHVEIPDDYEPRLILIEGDGAAQMTIQELTSMVRFQVPIEIMILNNNGYTIERAIRGPTRSYNDVMSWDWTKLLEAFGDFKKQRTVSAKIETRSKLAMKLKQLKNKGKLNLIELVEIKLDTMDFPKQLQSMVDAAAFTRKCSLE